MTQQRILILGSNGQVGQALQPALASLGSVTALDRSQADLNVPEKLQNIVAAYRPDIIVNAAAYTAVDKAESDADTARRVNTDSVAELASYAKANNALLIHYSTDYVFGGNKASPYVETDATNPLNVYGATKLAGEQAMTASGCCGLIFRTSWVFSAHGHNFIKTVLRLASDRDKVSIVGDQFGAPTSAYLIADVTAKAIAAQIPSGIYHLTAAGETCWQAYAQHIVACARANGIPLPLTPENIFPSTTESYPTPAKRPRNSRLNCAKLARALNFSFPDWREDVDLVVKALVSS